MTAKQLSERESAVLRIIVRRSTGAYEGATGLEIADDLNRDAEDVHHFSPVGAHQTAASLVRKGLAWRAGTPKLQWYRITEWGRRALKGDMSGEWVAR